MGARDRMTRSREGLSFVRLKLPRVAICRRQATRHVIRVLTSPSLRPLQAKKETAEKLANEATDSPLRPVHTGNWIAIRSRSDRDPTATLSTLATRSRSDRDRIAIRPIHIARWIRSRSDRDRLNPIRNSGRYLHVRYACSRNI